jgi:predicted TIM-barrel fold metal-dependent hydrolase
VIDPGLRGRPPTDVLASLRRLHYDLAMSATPGQLRCLGELVSPNRVLFGSDFPFMPAEQAEANAEGLRGYRELHGTEFEQVARGAAVALFPRLAALLTS